MKEYIIKLIICFILSFIIGLERELRGSFAGLRTNIIVALGSFLFTSICYIADEEELMRIPSQIISRIGFIGAGTIITDNNKIKGLNTAATIWSVSAIGILTSLDMINNAIIGTSAILFTNIFIRKIRKKISSNRYYYDDI